MGIRNNSRSRALPTIPTTHYPSWGSGTCHDSRFIVFNQNSLPLMGIKNLRTWVFLIVCPSSSLPLMGIRNLLGRCVAHPSYQSHYPSWGSGTWQPICEKRFPFDSLPLMGIRNKQRRHRAAHRTSSSLPLMGIRNSTFPDYQAARHIRNRPPFREVPPLTLRKYEVRFACSDP